MTFSVTGMNDESHDYHELPDGTWTFRQWMGAVLFAFAGPLLALDFWAHHGHSFFFDFLTPPTLLATGALAGVLCLWQFAHSGERLQAILAGVVTGFGVSGLMSIYTIWVNRDIFHSWEIIGVSLAGALPGVALFLLARRLRNRG